MIHFVEQMPLTDAHSQIIFYADLCITEYTWKTEFAFIVGDKYKEAKMKEPGQGRTQIWCHQSK